MDGGVSDMQHTTEIITLGDQPLGGEIEALVGTARRYPRSVSVSQRNMLDLATLDEEAANEAVYSFPRSGKAIEGPSVRFAEMAAQTWGNCRVAARTLAINRREKFVEAEGLFLDAETNVMTLQRIRRRIADNKNHLYTDDMILVTCNAAQAIARRNAILAGIPKAVWRRPYEAARQVIMGEVKTLANRRADAIRAFQRFGLTAPQVFALLGVKGEQDIDQERLVPLRGLYSSLANGEATVEDLLRGIAPERPAMPPPDANPLADPPDAPLVDAPPAAAKTPAKGKNGKAKVFQPPQRDGPEELLDRDNGHDADDAPIANPAAALAHLDGNMADCEDAESLREEWTGFQSIAHRFSDADRKKAAAAHDKHVKRVNQLA